MNENIVEQATMKWVLLLLAMLSGSLPACFSKREMSAPPSVIAFVNGASIKEDELRFYLDLERSNYDPKTLEDESRLRGVKKDILNRLIENRLIIDWGMKEGIMITEEELSHGMENMKKGYTQREFELMLEEKKIPVIWWRNMAEESLHVQKIIRESLGKKALVTEAEISSYYRSHPREFEAKERVKVRHIVTDTREKAEELRQRLNNGENFAKAAILHSISPDRSNGGELGYFSRGSYPEEFDVCFALNEGEISSVVQSSYGFHIFKLIDKKNRGMIPLDEVRDSIADRLFKEKIKKLFTPWLEDIRAASQVQILEDRVEKIKM